MSADADIPATGGSLPHGPLGGAFSRDKYVVSPAFDWIFFIGSPVLAVGVILGAWQLLPATSIEESVLFYMALGHHVPTFLRAYGDPDEFRANRFRLLVIPLCVLPLMALLYNVDSRLVHLIFLWDQYHFVRQHYGMMRFYDAKIGVAPRSASNLDQWLCFSAFVAILAHSDLYAYIYTSTLYDLGIVFPIWTGTLLRIGSLSVVAVVGALYLLNLQQRISQGEPVSALKLVTFLTTYGVWTFSYVVLSEPMLSYPISSLFHCLQYDALAWHYNRKKALALEARGGSPVFRFIHSSRNIWLYLLVILAYGQISKWGVAVAPGAILVVNRTTAILHYYFDSFIWRMRKPEFRRHI